MPEFLFAARDAAGNNIQGRADAPDMGAAVSQVAAMGYTLLHIELAQAAVPPPASVQSAGVNQDSTGRIAPPSPSSPTVNAASVDSTPIATSMASDILKADAAKRRKTESELTKLGMSPDEVARLLNANASTADSPSTPLPALTSGATLPPAVKKPSPSNRVSASSLESFAAELAASNAIKNKEAVRAVDLALPAFRESTIAERSASEALLRESAMLRRREKYREAEQKAREALFQTPSDASGLELLGDILQGVGRVDEALAAYKRATEADSTRKGAERKYGDLLMRQQNWNIGDPEAVAPNRWLNSILSLCLPGIGQAWNQEWVKAGLFFALDALCVYMLFYSPWATSQHSKHISPLTIGSFILTLVTYIAALIDSNIGAGKRPK